MGDILLRAETLSNTIQNIPHGLLQIPQGALETYLSEVRLRLVPALGRKEKGENT